VRQKRRVFETSSLIGIIDDDAFPYEKKILSAFLIEFGLNIFYSKVNIKKYGAAR